MVFFYKVIYVLRKKINNYKIGYLIQEHQQLYPGRFLFKGIHFSEPPDITIDGSKSKLIIGEGTATRGKISFCLFSDGTIDIGPQCFFNNHCSINCSISVSIGSNCLLGENVKIYDHNHGYKDSDKLIKDQGYTKAPVKIGDNCWIGSNAVILKGVTIGNNSVIGAGCVIFKDVPENSVVVNKGIVKVQAIQLLNK